MTRMPAWALRVLAVGLVVVLAVAVAAAPDQPAAPAPAGAQVPAAAQPQMVRLVVQFVTFTPKDASILGDNSDPREEFPPLGLACSNPRRPYAVKQPDGIQFYKGLEELVPELGPFDAFRKRDPAAVEKALARMDDRWGYHVLTLWGSGPVGSNLFAHGTAGPFPVRTADGTDVGPAETVEWKVTRVFRVDKLLGDGNAVVERADVLETLAEWGYDSWTARTGPAMVKVGACALGGNQSAGVHPYRTAEGVRVPAVVHPGFLFVDTIELGEWPKGPPWGAVMAQAPRHIGRLKPR